MKTFQRLHFRSCEYYVLQYSTVGRSCVGQTTGNFTYAKCTASWSLKYVGRLNLVTVHSCNDPIGVVSILVRTGTLLYVTTSTQFYSAQNTPTLPPNKSLNCNDDLLHCTVRYTPYRYRTIIPVAANQSYVCTVLYVPYLVYRTFEEAPLSASSTVRYQQQQQ